MDESASGERDIYRRVELGLDLRGGHGCGDTGRAMSQENMELVRRTMVELANRRDVDALDDLASADYEWHNARDLPGGGIHRGREAVKAQLRDYLPCVMGKFARTMASSTTLKPSKRWDWGSRRGVAPLVTRQRVHPAPGWRRQRSSGSRQATDSRSQPGCSTRAAPEPGSCM